jgi:hypothetical protein
LKTRVLQTSAELPNAKDNNPESGDVNGVVADAAYASDLATQAYNAAAKAPAPLCVISEDKQSKAWTDSERDLLISRL